MAYGGNLHISKVLSNLSIDYRNEEYIAEQVLSEIPVQKESDLYYVHTRDWRIADTYRANGSPSKVVKWNVSTSSYSLDEHALKDPVTDRDRSNSDVLNLDKETTTMLTDKIQLRHEKLVSDLLFTTGTWGNYTQYSTATSWSYNTTTSAPIQNVLSGTSVIIKSAGKRPNILVLGWDSFVALRENPNIYGRIQYAERAIITTDILAALFDVEKVFVGTAAYDAGEEGVVESLTSIWGGHALLAYKNPATGMKQLTYAATLRMNEKMKTKKWRDEAINGDWVEVSTMYVDKAVATSAAYYFTSVTSAMS